MTRQVALLRGINVGGRNMVPMAALRETLEGGGYTEVRTHLQSGNVVFSTGLAPGRVTGDLERLIADRFGLDIRVLVRTGEELAEVVAANPLPEAVEEPARFLVVFLSAAPPAPAVAGLDPAEYAPDVFRVQGREVYLFCPDGIRGSKLATFAWDRRMRLTATARNWNTVLRLVALASG